MAETLGAKRRREGRSQVDKAIPTKTFAVTLSLYPRDDQMLDELSDYFNAGRSDAARTAIRGLYVRVLGKQDA